MMRTYPLDAGAKTPLYEQLYRAIRQDIMSGALAGGQRMPSKRRLAAHLEVSQSTIETAYGQLAAEGYLLAKPRSGYFVQSMERAAPDTPAAPEAPAAPAAPDAPDAPDAPAVAFDLRTNRVDTDGFPFATWAKLLRGELTCRASQLLDAVPPQGAPELRAQICEYLAEFRGIRARPEQVVVGAGSEYLLMLLIQLLGRERVYALENPGYPQLRRVFCAGGAQVAPIGLDGSGLRVDALRRSRAGAVYLTPSHHFPLGVVMPAARRLEVLQWAAEGQDRYILEDDYDSEFRYASRPIPAMKQLDHAGRVIYLNTFAKSLAPSLRIGYMVLPERLLPAYRETLGFYASTVPSFEQYTLARFLQSGSFERHVARIRNRYKSRRDRLLAALQRSTLAGRLHVTGAEAGLHLLARLDGPLSEAQMVARAAQCGVRVAGLSGYYLPGSEACPPATVLLGYAGLAGDAPEQAVAALETAWG